VAYIREEAWPDKREKEKDNHVRPSQCFFLGALGPTIHYQEGALARLPFPSSLFLLQPSQASLFLRYDNGNGLGRMEKRSGELALARLWHQHGGSLKRFAPPLSRSPRWWLPDKETERQPPSGEEEKKNGRALVLEAPTR